MTPARRLATVVEMFSSGASEYGPNPVINSVTTRGLAVGAIEDSSAMQIGRREDQDEQQRIKVWAEAVEALLVAEQESACRPNSELCFEGR